MKQYKPRGEKQVFGVGPSGTRMERLVLPDKKSEIEAVIAKSWARGVDKTEPDAFDIKTLRQLPEDGHDFTIRTSDGVTKYLQLVEFTGNASFQGNYSSVQKRHKGVDRLKQVLDLIKKKSAHYGATENVYLLIYITDYRLNFMNISGVLGQLLKSGPQLFERIYFVSPKPDEQALIGLIHPFNGTPLSKDDCRRVLGGTWFTPGPEDVDLDEDSASIKL